MKIDLKKLAGTVVKGALKLALPIAAAALAEKTLTGKVDPKALARRAAADALARLARG